MQGVEAEATGTDRRLKLKKKQGPMNKGICSNAVMYTFGSVVYDAKKDTYHEEEPYRDIDVVDRIGSGDAYISGALYGLLSSDFDCEKAMQYGNATSAVKNTIPGDLPSSDLEEINTIIKAHNHKGPQLEMAR